MDWSRLDETWALARRSSPSPRSPRFSDRRDALRRALAEGGRDPDDFTFAAQLGCGRTRADRSAALEVAGHLIEAGANHVILGLPASVAPGRLADVIREVAEPLRARFG